MLLPVWYAPLQNPSSGILWQVFALEVHVRPRDQDQYPHDLSLSEGKTLASV